MAACYYHGEDTHASIVDYSCNGIKEFYVEATCRLPLREVPELVAGIKAGGHCFGLADPVTNIILNAVGLLLSDEGPSRAPPTHHEPWGFFITDSWEDIATRSELGLRAFMAAYFRYLGRFQAWDYLRRASNDLPRAIKLVRRDRLAPARAQRPLLPDGGRLRAAAAHARHPAPDALARLMTARYPARMLAPVLAKLRGTAEPLTVHDVWSVRDLLARQWPMDPAPAANIEFWCRPDGGDTCVSRGEDGAVLIWTSVGEDRTAQIAIRNTPDHVRSQQHYISDLTFDDDATSSDMEEAKPYKCCLQTDPPVGRPPGAEAELPDGILDTDIMSRVEARSLDGLVAILRGSAPGMSELEALRYLSSTDCDLSQLPLPPHRGSTETNGDCSFAAAAKAAKHPQHAAFGSFLASLSHEKLSRMRCLFPGRIISDAPWDLLNTTIRREASDSLRRREVSLSAQNTTLGLSPWASEQVSSKRSSFQSQLAFVRTELNKALRRYCYQHPWEPSYQLDIICGVAVRSGCYHANFLARAADDANTDDDVTMLPPERSLFFAEFWGSSLSQWKPPSCCPIPDYCASTGRCSFCEDEANKIVHPPSGAHSRADIDASKDLCCSTVHNTHMDRLKGLLDSDYIYFDPERDVEVAKI